MEPDRVVRFQGRIFCDDNGIIMAIPREIFRIVGIVGASDIKVEYHEPDDEILIRSEEPPDGP